MSPVRDHLDCVYTRLSLAPEIGAADRKAFGGNNGHSFAMRRGHDARAMREALQTNPCQALQGIRAVKEA